MIVFATGIAAVGELQRCRSTLSEQENLPVEVLEQIISLMSIETIPICKNFYEEVIPSLRPSTFRAHFRMLPETVELILEKIAGKPEFQKRDQIEEGRRQVEPSKCFLIALWTLATPQCYRAIGSRFDVANSTVLWCLNVVVHCINRYLTPLFIKWPTNIEKEDIAHSFQRYGLPRVIGSIDGCHIPIKRPKENPEDYFNRKKFYSLVLQGIVRNNLMFVDVDVRWPGSVHDARVLRTSDVYLTGQQLCQPHFFIIGDSAYPCLQWIISPYRNTGHLNQQQLYFNQVLSKTRVVVENAFALLKGRFRRLKNLLDRNDIQDICNTIVACCGLHNICLFYQNEDLEDFMMEERIEEIPMEGGGNYNNEGEQLRNELMQIVWNNRPHP